MTDRTRSAAASTWSMMDPAPSAAASLTDPARGAAASMTEPARSASAPPSSLTDHARSTARSTPSAVDPSTSSVTDSSTPTLGAILLAGGRASRMGGIDKPGLEIGGMSMRDRAIRAATLAGADPVVVVGPQVPTTVGVRDDSATLRWVREDPPFTGPAAALVAALDGATGLAAAHEPEWTLVLACDLPRVDAAVRRLVGDIMLLPADTDGACLADDSGRPQWLTGVYRTAALRGAAAAAADAGRGMSMRALLADLATAAVRDGEDAARDIDTWDDLEHFTKEES